MEASMQDSQVQEIKDKINIVEVVGQYVQLHRAGRTYTAKCPFHKEKTPSFHVSPERGTYICFGCGEKGDVFSFVQKMESVDFRTALKHLADRAGVVLKHSFVPKTENVEKEERLREVCEAATIFFEQELAKRADVGEYLTKRGVTEETKKAWRIGYAPATWRSASEYLASVGFSKDEIVDAGIAARSQRDEQPSGTVNNEQSHREANIYDRFRGRIMFPLCDANGRVIAFSGRFFEDIKGVEQKSEPAKYVNSPETLLFKKSRVLYGFDKAKNAIRKADCILLVEGQFDVVLSHQSGLPFAVAISGTALTDEHLALLGRFSKRLVLALDGDAAGIRAGLKSALMAYAAGFDVKVPRFPDGKDPADIAKDNPDELRAIIRESKTAIEFFLKEMLKEGLNERSYKREVQSQVIPLIAAISSAIDQEHFINIAARWLGDVGAIRKEVAIAKAARIAAVSRAATSTHSSSTAPVASAGSISARAVSAQDAQQGTDASPELVLDPMLKKAAMIACNFGVESEQYIKLVVLLGEEKVHSLLARVEPIAERIRFDFDREVGEHSTKEIIAADLLADIGRVVAKERYKMKYL